MKIIRENGEIIYPADIPQTGVIFLFCSWSESVLYLQYLISILNKYPSIPLFVVNIDDDLYLNFKNKYNIKSHGNGETFWVYEGEVFSKVIDYRLGKENLDKNTIELLNVINRPLVLRSQ